MPPQISETSNIIRTARELYDLGLNVCPMPINSEQEYPSWRMLTYQRLQFNPSAYELEQLFAGRCRIGVVIGSTSRNLLLIRCETQAEFCALLATRERLHLQMWISCSEHGGEAWMFCDNGVVQKQQYGLPPRVFLVTEGIAPWPGDGLYVSGSEYWHARDTIEPPIHSIDQISALLGTLRTELGLPSTTASVRVVLEGTALNKAAQAVVRKTWSVRQRRARLAYAFLALYTWPGRTRSTDPEVFRALIHCMLLDANKQGVFHASGRRLDELAGRNRKTIVRSLKRLLKANLIERRGANRTSRAFQYQFSAYVYDEGKQALKSNPSLCEPYSHLRTLVNGELFNITDLLHPYALGANAALIYDFLLGASVPYTISDLQKAHSMSRSIVVTALKKLIRRQLVEFVGTPKRYRAIHRSPAELMCIAEEAGTFGRLSNRKTLHARERAHYVARCIWLDRLRVDSENLPLEYQFMIEWSCPDCGEALAQKEGLLPEWCPTCGSVVTGWRKQMKSRIRSRHASNNQNASVELEKS